MTLISKNSHSGAGADGIFINDEQLSQTLIKDSSDMIIFINAEDLVTSVSPAIIPCTGYAPEEMIGHRVFEFVHPDDADVLHKVLTEVKQISGKGLCAEYRLRCKNGEWRWCEGSVTNLLDVPAVGAIIGTFHDITRQKLAPYPGWHEINTSELQQKATSLEAEVEERKATEKVLLHLAAIVESSDDAILSKDLDGIITSWNAAAERMFGYSAQEIVGQSVSIIFTSENKDEFLQIMENIRQGKSIDHYETKRVRKDGTVLAVSVTVSPVKDRSGRIIGASDITRDITAQRQLEAKFRRLFDSKLIGVFVSELNGTFLDANDALLDLLGYTRAELLKGEVQCDTLTPPEFRLVNQKAVQELYETGSSGPCEKEYIHKSGRRIPVLIAVTRIELTDTCIGFVLDISERKELDKRKDEFISMASHELKTPVTSLKGFLGILQRHLATQEEGKLLHYVTRMDAQVNKLTKLINDLLDLSKMQRGQLAYREECFEMDALVQEVIENVQETTQTHRLMLEGRSQASVFGDRDRIGQVLINLLNNAIKYSPQANAVLVHVAKEQDKAIVSIQDFGIGIAEEYQQKIFERFFQIIGAEGKTFPGLGMGLYISSEIIKRHGGRMWVESELGKGAKFCFSLPLA